MGFDAYIMDAPRYPDSNRIRKCSASLTVAKAGHDMNCRFISREEAEDLANGADPEVSEFFQHLLEAYPDAEELYFSYSY